LAQWLGFGGLVAGYARVTGRRLRDVLHWRAPRVRSVAGAVLVGLSGWVILGGVMERLAPAPRELVESMRRMIRPGGEERALWLSLTALAVTPAVCEEALFRGPILRGLRERFSTPAACLLTGILFGILHGDVWRFVPTATLGVLLSWVARASGSIVPAMVVHVVNNGALVALGFYGWDKRLEALPLAAEVGIGLIAVTILATGIALIRSGRRTSTPK
jgi:sodium transport system permease protein